MWSFNFIPGKGTAIAILKRHQNTVYFLADTSQELPAAALGSKEDQKKKKERERRTSHHLRFTALEREGSKYKILAECVASMLKFILSLYEHY